MLPASSYLVQSALPRPTLFYTVLQLCNRSEPDSLLPFLLVRDSIQTIAPCGSYVCRTPSPILSYHLLALGRLHLDLLIAMTAVHSVKLFFRDRSPLLLCPSLMSPENRQIALNSMLILTQLIGQQYRDPMYPVQALLLLLCLLSMDSVTSLLWSRICLAILYYAISTLYPYLSSTEPFSTLRSTRPTIQSLVYQDFQQSMRNLLLSHCSQLPSSTCSVLHQPAAYFVYLDNFLLCRHMRTVDAQRRDLTHSLVVTISSSFHHLLRQCMYS